MALFESNTLIDRIQHTQKSIDNIKYINLTFFGLVRDLNPGPLTPKARIIPLDQRAYNSHTFLAFAYKASISVTAPP
jgi:hypothetical protein